MSVRQQIIGIVQRTPTFEISAFAALAIFGLFAFVTANVGMTPAQADAWAEAVPAAVSGTYEYAVRPPYWRLQSIAGQLVFMLAAFGETAHHLLTNQ